MILQADVGIDSGRIIRVSLFLSILLFSFPAVRAQDTLAIKKKDSVAILNEPGITKFIADIDVIDVALALIQKKDRVRKDSLVKIPGKFYVSAVPAVGYTLITGLAVTVAANVAFYTSDEETANVSSILTEPAYTQFHQI